MIPFNCFTALLSFFVAFMSNVYAQDLAKTNAFLIDRCTKKQVVVATPNGVALLLKLDGLNPYEDVNFKLTYRLAGENESQSPNDLIHDNFSAKKFRRLFRDSGRLDEKGSLEWLINLPADKLFEAIEKRHHGFRLWALDVTWRQEGDPGKSGHAFLSFYRKTDSPNSFFQVIKPEYCHWESDATISSKLYSNDDNVTMSINREYLDIHTQTSTMGIGMSAGTFTRVPNSTIPLFSVSNAGYMGLGWLFKDWQIQISKKQFTSMSRKYVLNRYSHGVFATRLTFGRREVLRWTWVKKNGLCGEYRYMDRGYLDVGVEAEDFYEIPASVYGRGDEANKFINQIRATVDTCGNDIDKGPSSAVEIIPNGLRGMMFYYKKNL